MSASNVGEFIDFLVRQGVLKFGEFTLNSGRKSPYFFNLGEVSSGEGYAVLAAAYADALLRSNITFDVLFGPAYKGIPIAVATAQAMATKGRDVAVAYNRKEPKDHGEGGMLVGAALDGPVVLVDDVLTSGKAIRSAAALIAEAGAEIAGVVIAMDRAEVGPSGRTAVAELSQELAVPVVSIAHVNDLMDYLAADGGYEEVLLAMGEYRQNYCQA